jgi:four helix bundle protein
MEEIRFDFENLKVYQRALDFIDKIFCLLKDLPREYRFSIGDNLLRAALSIANNIAEGNDKTSNKERYRYFNTSSDSARECVSVFIVLKRQKLIKEDFFIELKEDAREITSMLRGLQR